MLLLLYLPYPLPNQWLLSLYLVPSPLTIVIVRGNVLRVLEWHSHHDFLHLHLCYFFFLDFAIVS